MGWNESEQQVPADLAFLSSLCRQALPTLSPLRFRGPADAMDEIRHTVTGTVIKFVEAGFNGHVVVTARDISLHNGVPFVSPVHCLAEIVLQCSAPTRAAVQRARLLRPVARDYQGLTDSNSPLRLTSFQWDAILSKLPHFVELAGDAGIDWYILFGCYGEARELV
ncbi:uncharacterized protein BDV14DRAFT_186181 [Aspergillus stella-maris]|uniref:uncharacterized protein n=1 Tax=Aspergillus stella-maris TaxID=1810926 RepID=UPI003CCCD5B9